MRFVRKNCVFFSTFLILSAQLFLVDKAHSAASAPKSSFIKKVKNTLNFINESVAKSLVKQVDTLRQDIDTLTSESYEQLQELTQKIAKLRQEGVIDLKLTYKELYDLIAKKSEMAIAQAGGGAVLSEVITIQGDLQSVAIEVAALRELADKYEALAEQVNPAIEELKALAEIKKGQSRDSMKKAISALINKLRDINQSGNSVAISAALALELDALINYINSKPEMVEEELNVMADAIKRIVNAAVEELGSFGELYKATAEKLNSIADDLEKSGDTGAAQVAIDEFIASLDQVAADAISKQNISAEEIAALEERIAKYKKDLERLEKFRKFESEIVTHHGPVCEKINEYEMSRDPEAVFEHINQSFAEFVGSNREFAADFKTKAKAIGQAITKISGKAGEDFQDSGVAPPKPEGCGNLYVKPVPGGPSGNPPQIPGTAAALNFPGFTPIDNPLGENPFCAFGNCDDGKKPGKKTNKKTPKAITDPQEKKLMKLAKKFLKQKDARIRDAFFAVHGVDMSQ